MNLGVVVVCFGLVAVAELPDKTMIATLVMGSRGRPLPVWAGASAAFLVHVAVAVVAGRLLELLPHTVLEAVVAALFLAGATYLLVIPERREVDKGRTEGESPATTAWWAIAGTAFGVILVGEIGDLTQLLTVNLVAKYHQPLSVGVGAWLALVTVSAVGSFSGQALLKVVPVTLIRRIGGVALLGFAAFTLYGLATA